MKITKSELKQIIVEELSKHTRAMMQAIRDTHMSTAAMLRKVASQIPDIQKVLEKYPEVADYAFREAALEYNEYARNPYSGELEPEAAYRSLLMGFHNALESRREYPNGELRFIPAVDQALADELFGKWEKA